MCTKLFGIPLNVIPAGLCLLENCYSALNLKYSSTPVFLSVLRVGGTKIFHLTGSYSNFKLNLFRYLHIVLIYLNLQIMCLIDGLQDVLRRGILYILLIFKTRFRRIIMYVICTKALVCVYTVCTVFLTASESKFSVLCEKVWGIFVVLHNSASVRWE